MPSKKITEEIAKEVREIAERHPSLTQEEIGRMCSERISGASVSRILNPKAQQTASERITEGTQTINDAIVEEYLALIVTHIEKIETLLEAKKWN